MKKNLSLVLVLVLLNSCAESLALLGPLSTIGTGGKVAQSAVSSGVSYGVKKQTGKTPSQHALAYVKKHNPENKKENCIGIKSTNSKACTIANKKVALAKSKVKETVTDKTASFKTQFAKARNAGKDYFVFKNKIYNTSFKEKNNSKKKSIFFKR